jgi:hypothetical protein
MEGFRPTLLSVAREKMRTRHLAYRTEQAYLQWIRRYLRFHDRRHPRELGAEGVEQFLSHLATHRNYSLYDALVSINVPNDKARAVVDAMERDMGTTLATKADLRPLATREELAQLREGLALLGKDMELLSAQQTVRLGSMLVVGLTVLFAALKFS